MLVNVLGCRAAMPADGQASSSYLVSTTSTRVLLDCGPGALTALSAVTTPDALDAIVVSHLHTDHCYDLLPLGKSLLTARLTDREKYPTLPGAGTDPVPPIPLYVPRGGRAALERLASAFPIPSRPVLDQAFDLAFDVREYEPGDDVAVGDAHVALRPLDHTLPNCGSRVTGPDGASMVYSGDTCDGPGLTELAHDAGLLLCEATLEREDDRSDGHLNATRAGRIAEAAGADELVLTHFVTADPGWLAARADEARRGFSGPVHVASPGRTFPVPAVSAVSEIAGSVR